MLPLLRLGASAKSPSDWDLSQRNLHYLYGIDPSNDAELNKLQRKLQEFVRALRRIMRENDPAPDAAREIAIAARDFWGAELIRQVFPAYRRQQDFQRAWNGFLALLSECTGVAENWRAVLDEFEGKAKYLS